MSEKLTEAVFSMQCSFIAKNASAWAADILTLPENYNSQSDVMTVAFFTDDMRARLDRLDAWEGRAAMDDGPERLEAVANSVASMVIEWVDGGVRGNLDWRPGLANVIQARLYRFGTNITTRPETAEKVRAFMAAREETK